MEKVRWYKSSQQQIITLGREVATNIPVPVLDRLYTKLADFLTTGTHLAHFLARTSNSGFE